MNHYAGIDASLECSDRNPPFTDHKMADYAFGANPPYELKRPMPPERNIIARAALVRCRAPQIPRQRSISKTCV
jgi:hypothetical protein